MVSNLCCFGGKTIQVLRLTMFSRSARGKCNLRVSKAPNDLSWTLIKCTKRLISEGCLLSTRMRSTDETETNGNFQSHLHQANDGWPSSSKTQYSGLNLSLLNSVNEWSLSLSLSATKSSIRQMALWRKFGRVTNNTPVCISNSCGGV